MVSELTITTELSVIRPINISTKYLSYVSISLQINYFNEHTRRSRFKTMKRLFEIYLKIIAVIKNQ